MLLSLKRGRGRGGREGRGRREGGRGGREGEGVDTVK